MLPTEVLLTERESPHRNVTTLQIPLDPRESPPRSIDHDGRRFKLIPRTRYGRPVYRETEVWTRVERVLLTVLAVGFLAYAAYVVLTHGVPQ